MPVFRYLIFMKLNKEKEPNYKRCKKLELNTKITYVSNNVPKNFIKLPSEIIKRMSSCAMDFPSLEQSGPVYCHWLNSLCTPEEEVCACAHACANAFLKFTLFNCWSGCRPSFFFILNSSRISNNWERTQWIDPRSAPSSFSASAQNGVVGREVNLDQGCPNPTQWPDVTHSKPQCSPRQDPSYLACRQAL